MFLMKEKNESDIDALRIDIALIFVANLCFLAWFFVQVLIIHVFVKYATPLEDDALILIQQNLLKDYYSKENYASDDEIRFHRRMKAYAEFAD